MPWDDLRLQQVEASASQCPDVCAVDVVSLIAEVRRLREALADSALTWHRGIVHMSEPPFTLEACKYERCRTADALLGKPA